MTPKEIIISLYISMCTIIFLVYFIHVMVAFLDCDIEQMRHNLINLNLILMPLVVFAIVLYVASQRDEK